MLHFVEAGDGDAERRGDGIDQRLGVGVLGEDELGGAFGGLGGEADRLVGVEADLDATLRRGPDGPEEEGDVAAAPGVRLYS